jgi:hypothetical protein
MKKKLFLLLPFLFLFFGSALQAQNCKYFPAAEKGTVMEYTMFDRNGREEAKQTQTVTELKNEGNATVAVFKTSEMAKRGKEEPVSATYELKCRDGKFFMDMSSFTSSFNYEQYQNIEGSEVTIKSDDLYYPSDMAVGSALPDGSLEVTVNINDVPMINAEITISKRKVEKMETIKTSAGSFECLKITSEIMTKTNFSDGAKSKVTQWVAEGVGVVKSESQTDGGKLIGYQLLSGIVQPE